MPYEKQKAIQRELNSHIPRGRKGSTQNKFRFAFYFYRSRGMTFEDSVRRATEDVRQHEPDFVPHVKG